MKGSAKKYIPLTGNKRAGKFLGFEFGSFRLWQGADHVMLVKSTGYTEDYQRFYFRDIQAITTSASMDRLVYTILLSFLLVLFLLFTNLGNMTHSYGCALAHWIGVGLLTGLITLNNLLGPTCRCTIKTAVSEEPLPVRRVRKARKLVERLRPLIEAAQGGITREDAVRKTIEQPAASGPVRPARKAGRTLARPLREYSGNAHAFLFGSLLLNASIVTAEVFVESTALTALLYAAILGSTILTVLALVKQHDSRVSPGLTRSTWGALVYICSGYVIAIVLYMYIIVNNTLDMQTNWQGITSELSALSPYENPFVFFVFLFFILMPAAVGSSGLIAYLRHRAEAQ